MGPSVIIKIILLILYTYLGLYIFSFSLFSIKLGIGMWGEKGAFVPVSWGSLASAVYGYILVRLAPMFRRDRPKLPLSRSLGRRP